jgi:hypothetical protein
MPLCHPTLITTLVAGAFFMENLDGTIMATALRPEGQAESWSHSLEGQ